MGNGMQVDLVPDSPERVPVMLTLGGAAGKAVKSEFHIPGGLGPTFYRVRARLSKTDGATVWCESIGKVGFPDSVPWPPGGYSMPDVAEAEAKEEEELPTPVDIEKVPKTV